MKEGDEEVSATESQYEERFWRRRLDGIALDTVNKKCYLIEFKRTRDRRHSYEARAMEVARKQYESLMGPSGDRGAARMGDRSTGVRRRNVRISKGGVFQQEFQATRGTRRQVESPTAANGKKTFGSTGHGVNGLILHRSTDK